MVVLATPGVSVAEVTPLGGYADQPFFTGFLEGYNTMEKQLSGQLQKRQKSERGMPYQSVYRSIPAILYLQL